MKKRKLYPATLADIAPYHGYARIPADISPVGVAGFVYYVDALDDVARATLANYNNVHICTIGRTSDPHYRKRGVLLTDKCFK